MSNLLTRLFGSRNDRVIKGHGRVVRAASEFEAATQAHRIEWHWVKGHSGNVGNERADALANRGIDELVSGGAARLR